MNVIDRNGFGDTTTLVIGASGLLGPYLMRSAARLGPVTGLSRRGPDVECDLLDFAAVRRWLRENPPKVVIYAAALTDVDYCQSAAELADALHRQAVANVVDGLPDGVQLVYISTDQVYPDTPGPHKEETTSPVNIYGKSKLAGEYAALEYPGALVLRANLFGPSLTPGRQSLSDFMLEKLTTKSELTLFKDVLFSPLHIETLSDLVTELISKNVEGVFNIGCREGKSKMEFGYALARHFQLPLTRVKEVDSTMLPGRVRRIKDMCMDVGKLEKVLNRRLPTLFEEISKL